MLDIVTKLRNNNEEGVILSCDYQKCFDKIDFSALLGSLRYFGFHNNIIKWTDILYTDFNVKIQNNGNFSEKIDVQQGVHQGGPASSLYFLVIAEILAINIRTNKEIKGIPIEEIINILSQFADDMDVFSEFDQGSMDNILHEINDFHTHTGFTISYDKTTLYRVGSLRKTNAKLYTQQKMNWSNDTIKVLGINIYQENKVLLQQNYAPAIQKANAITVQWSKRNLSMFGKINIVNTLIASLFIYKMMVLPNMTQDIVNKINQVITYFIWGGKRSKISLKILQSHKKQGGAGLTNIVLREKAIKATWVQILHTNVQYSMMIYKMLKICIGEIIWKCNLRKEHVRQAITGEFEFWNNVLEAWCTYNFEENVKKPGNQIIWYNSCILIDNQVFFWKKQWGKRTTIFISTF